MNAPSISFLACIMLFYISFILYKMRSARWICKKEVEDAQNDDDYMPDKEVIWFKALVTSVITFLIHISDFVSDILYITTVPMYSPWIKILMIIFIMPPPMLWFLGSFCGIPVDEIE